MGNRFLRTLDSKNQKIINAELSRENEVNFSGKSLTPDQAKKLSEALKNNTTLKSLELPANKIDDTSISHIARALEINKSVTRLDLSFNFITDKGIKALAKTLKKNHQLRALHLKGIDITDEGMIALAQALQTNNSLSHLELDHNSFSTKSIKVFFERLAKKQTLTRLNISLNFNQLDKTAGQPIGHMLSQNPSVLVLDLSANNLGDSGSQAIARGLENNTKLEFLNLSYNTIGTKGVKALALALKKNKAIKALNISGNTISPEGIRALADMLQMNTTLIALIAPNVELSEKEIDALLSAIESNEQSAMKTLNFKDATISKVGMERLMKTLEKNSKITNIVLPACPHLKDDERFALIADMLKTNTSLTYLECSGQVNPDIASDIFQALNRNQALHSAHLSSIATSPAENNALKDAGPDTSLKNQRTIASIFIQFWNWLKDSWNTFKQGIEAKFNSTAKTTSDENPKKPYPKPSQTVETTQLPIEQSKETLGKESKKVTSNTLVKQADNKPTSSTHRYLK